MAGKQKVVVIGAGMAGLTCAHFLAEAGVETIVVERDVRPGGRIVSIEKDGEVIDVGAQFVHTNYRVTLDLCRKLGLESDLVEMKNADMIMRDGRAHIIPWGGIRMPAISLWSQVKSARLFGPILRRRKSMALEGWPDLLDLDGQELATYARAKLNEECLEYLVRPLMLTYSMAEPEGLSVAYFMRSLYMYVTTGAHCFRSGNDVLPKALARDLDVRYDTAVREIACDSDGKVCGVRTSGGELEASVVVSAIPAPALLPLYAGWAPEQEAFLREFTFTRLPLVVFEGPVRDAVSYWGGVFDRSAGDRISFMTYAHMKYRGAARPRYLLAWPMGDFGEELIGRSDQEIVEAVTQELRKSSPADAESIESASVFRHPHTYPQYKVGMFEKLLRFKKSEGRPSGLYLAGDYTEGGLIEGAAQSGKKVARRLMAAT